MFDESRLRANPQSLTGLLLIKSVNEVGGTAYFVLASTDSRKLLEAMRDMPESLESIVRDSDELTRKIGADFGINAAENMGFWVYGIGGFIPSYTGFPIRQHDDLDHYDAGTANDPLEFEKRAGEIVITYFKRFWAQQESKPEKGISEAQITIAETPAEKIIPMLYKLSAGLLGAVKDRNPLAQLEAEDSLHAFAFGNAFRYSVEQIIQLASSIRPSRVELIGLQCRIIGALAVENYKCAKDLQGLYERMIPSPVFSGEKV